MRVNSQRFPIAELNTVIRLRSVCLKKESENGGTDVIQLCDGPYTNILKFEPYFKQAMVISERMIDDDLLQALCKDHSE